MNRKRDDKGEVKAEEYELDRVWIEHLFRDNQGNQDNQDNRDNRDNQDNQVGLAHL